MAVCDRCMIVFQGRGNYEVGFGSLCGTFLAVSACASFHLISL